MIYRGLSKTYNLEKQLAAGGEGSVWAIDGNANVVAKVYHPEKIASDPKLEKKISYMVKNPPSDSIMDQIAWPMDVLRDNAGRFVGFIMPKLDTDADLKKIYPYPPKREMPVTTEQKLIIAINICIVISEVHKAGYIFGDFNPMNIGVNLKNGHVAFFDADSYHFTDVNSNETYRCGVGADGYIAPELIQKCHDYHTDFLETPLPTFTKETDEFALAIHIFKLLMNGYTPFNGIKECESASQSSPGTGNIAIERGNYCFKPGNKPQSPATPDLSSLTPDIQFLFKKTFLSGNKNPKDRATADEWKNALIEYKDNLVKCPNNPMHFYYVNNVKCPYCEADNRYQQSIMGATQTYGTGSSGSSTSQYSFVTPVSIPQSNSTGTGNTGANTQTGYGSVGKKRKNPILILIKISLWLLCFPLMFTISVLRKKNWNIIIRLLLVYIICSWWFMFVNAARSAIESTSKTENEISKEMEEEMPPAAPLGTEILNLKEYEAFDAVNVDADIAAEFAPNKSWDNSLKFRAGNGEDYAYASYTLDGKFEKLTLRMQPYNYDVNFLEYASAELQIIDLDTGYIIHREPMTADSLPIDVEVDVAGINNLRIMVIRTGGILAYCVLSDIFAYPGDGSGISNEDEKVVTVTTENANIRSGAGKGYDVIATGNNGDQFVITGNVETAENGAKWHEIYIDGSDGQTGWISDSIVEMKLTEGQNVIVDSASKYGDDALNLKNEIMYNSQCVDGDVPLTFTLYDHLWTNALDFRAGNGYDNAYAVWEVAGEYSKLSFEVLPYYGECFMDGSEAEIQIVNAETGEILYSTALNCNSDVQEATVDISGVNYLKINVDRTGGILAYCLVNDAYIYN